MSVGDWSLGQVQEQALGASMPSSSAKSWRIWPRGITRGHGAVGGGGGLVHRIAPAVESWPGRRAPRRAGLLSADLADELFQAHPRPRACRRRFREHPCWRLCGLSPPDAPEGKRKAMGFQGHHPVVELDPQVHPAQGQVRRLHRLGCVVTSASMARMRSICRGSSGRSGPSPAAWPRPPSAAARRPCWAGARRTGSPRSLKSRRLEVSSPLTKGRPVAVSTVSWPCTSLPPMRPLAPVKW